jgi:hypothetical protein
VKHRASPRFWRAYRGLPRELRRLADRSYKLLKDNPAHPSLHFKKVGKFWSARVGLHHRTITVEADADLVWFWIGSHDGYDKLLDKKPANMRLQPTAARRHGKSRKAGRRG